MSRCPECGLDFACGAAEGKEGTPCWCAQLPALASLPASAGTDEAGNIAACFCPTCLRRRIADLQKPGSTAKPSGPKTSA